MLYTALISSHHCSNEANIEKLKDINIYSNYVFLSSIRWSSMIPTAFSVLTIVDRGGG